MCTYTVTAQIEQRHSNFYPEFFVAVGFRFEPNCSQVFVTKSGLLVKKLTSAAIIKSVVVLALIQYLV